MNNPEQIEQQLGRYMRSETTPAESAAVEQWLSDHVADPRYDAIFRRLLDQTPADVDPAAMSRARQFLERLLDSDAPPRRSLLRRTLTRAAEYAAVAAVVAVALTFVFRSQPVEWHEEYAAWGENRKVELPDGSMIWLNSGSRIFYPSKFASETRTIYIDGEIFADVAHNPDQPFIVSASGVKVRVLGTQFILKSYAENANVEVALVRGSVALQAGENARAVDYTLQVGEMVRYHKATGAMESYRVDTGTYGTWHKNHNLCFVNQSLGDIACDLERRFDVQIVIENAELARAQYYASFVNNESLDQILKALNSGNTMRITHVNDTIVISRN